MRIAGWTAAGVLLALSWIVMQITEDVRWSSADFLFWGVLLGGAGLALELTVRRTANAAYRLAVASALLFRKADARK